MSKPRRTQAERSEEMRARLARAAYEIIAERGISSLRTAAVVERIGVSQGALLHHFANKEELVLAAVDYSLTLESERSEKAIERAAALDRPAILAAIIEDFRLFFFSDIFWATLDTTMDSSREKALKMHVTEAVAHYRRPVYEHWQTLLVDAGMAEDDARELVVMTAALIAGYAMRSLWQDVSGQLEGAIARWSRVVAAAWPLAA